MKLIDMIATQNEQLAMVDTTSAALKAGVILRTLWELAKPFLFLTALFLRLEPTFFSR